MYQYTDHYDDWVENSTLYQKLKEDNKILKDATDAYEDLLAGEKGFIDKNEELEKEVKLLQDQLEDADDDKICDLLECDHDGRYDAIRELKDEYDELKEKNWREVAEKMVEYVTPDGFTIVWNKNTNELLDADDGELIGKMVFNESGEWKPELAV